MEVASPSARVRNKGWFHTNEANAVLVFVHGVLSDNDGAWRYEDKKAGAPSVYWPALIRSDNRFQDIAIFLGGYHTAIDAGPYGIRVCAREVFDAMNVTDSQSRPPPLDKTKITFVCRSLGGIVCRYLLAENYPAFASKRVGLFLLASPSSGSAYADGLQPISELYRNQQGRELAWKSWALQDLDARFRTLLDKGRIPNLYGRELCEHHFLDRRRRSWKKWLPFRAPPVVSPESAARYFGPVKTIPGSDHSSICKPRDPDDDVHNDLLSFLVERDLLPGDSGLRGPPLEPLDDFETARNINVLLRLTEWLAKSPQLGREEALGALHAALLETRKYVGDRRAGAARSRTTEKLLSDLWLKVAAHVQYDGAIAVACMVKGHGWADDRVWGYDDFRHLPLDLNKLLELSMKDRGTAARADRSLAQEDNLPGTRPDEAELARKVRRVTDEASAKIIETAVRRRLDIPRGELAQDDFAQVTELDLSGTAISDLGALRNLTSLVSLDLSNRTALRDLAPSGR